MYIYEMQYTEREKTKNKKPKNYNPICKGTMS